MDASDHRMLLDRHHALLKCACFLIHYRTCDGATNSVIVDCNDTKRSLQSMKNVAASAHFLEWVEPEYVTNRISEFCNEH